MSKSDNIVVMNIYIISLAPLLCIVLIGTVMWLNILTRHIDTAPSLANKPGVRGTALLTKYLMPCLSVCLVIAFMTPVYSHSLNPIAVVAMYLILFAMYGILYRVLKEQVAAETSRFSSGKNTWRGKRALKWARETVIGIGAIYTLFLSLLLAIANNYK